MSFREFWSLYSFFGFKFAGVYKLCNLNVNYITHFTCGKKLIIVKTATHVSQSITNPADDKISFSFYIRELAKYKCPSQHLYVLGGIWRPRRDNV